MAEIPRSDLDGFSDALSKLTEQARKSLERAIGKLAQPTDAESFAAYRNAVIGLVNEALSAACPTSARYSAEFYRKERSDALGEDMDVTYEDMRDPAETDGAVRAAMRHMQKGGAGYQTFLGEVTRHAESQILRAANENTVANCRIVPQFGRGSGVEGYDPDRYYDMWKNPESTSRTAKQGVRSRCRNSLRRRPSRRRRSTRGGYRG